MNYLQPHEQRPKGIKDLNPNALTALAISVLVGYIILNILINII